MRFIFRSKNLNFCKLINRILLCPLVVPRPPKVSTMEGKKISFGFIKTKKFEKPVVEEKKDFIECLEEKAIKVVGGEQEEENEPLVIPMKPNTLITAERLREIAEKVESGLDEVIPMPAKENNGEIKKEPTENLTLDQLAVKELLQEAKKEVKVEQQELTVPIPAKLVIDGQKESTLEDYESVPIQNFGMAMLRGMGWTANKEQLAKYKPPTLRPKGLGLGADKVINDKQKKKTLNKDGKEEELSIVKNSYVKIIAGKYSGYYGKVVSLDEENGRVMVDITMKKETVSLSEFMMQPVTKAEFDKESKVINSGAYEEYKKNEISPNKKSSRNESPNVPEKQRHDSPNVNSREASSSRRSNDIYNERNQEREIKESRRNNDKGSNGKGKSRQERSRRNSSNEEENRSNKHEYIRDSSSEDRNRRNRRDKSRNNSEERDSRRKAEKSRRDSSSSEDRNSRRKKEKSKRDSSTSEEDKKYRKKKSKSKRDSSSEDRDRSDRRKIETSRRYSSEERGKRRLEKDKKRYSSNESLESISDSEKKKNKRDRRRKDSSESEDCRKKDKRDIDKKRKGKKKKRDRDRSPNYKKYRK